MATSEPETPGSTRLRIVAGKGGVGRTTVSVALATQAAAAGKRVLVVDAVGTGDLDRLVAAADDLPPFTTLDLTTGEALDQYLKIYLRLPITPRRIGPLARIFDYVSAAAPGVREILVIGKIGWEVRQGQWDEVIVDAPATGHVVELLDAPRTMAELVPTGPLADQTGWLREILASERSGVVVVTSPDELSVLETGELLARIDTETETRVEAVLANRVPIEVGETGRAEIERLVAADAPAAPLAVLAGHRSDQARLQLDLLGRVLAERAGAAPSSGADRAALEPVEVSDDPERPVAAVLAALQTLPAADPLARDAGPT